jgi:GNAT superfamily N-acetyltransferase
MIRQAREEDIPSIRRIIVDAFGENTIHFILERKFGAIGGKGWDERKADEIEQFFRGHPDQVRVTEAAGRVLGFISFAFNLDRNMGVVLNNAVDPEHQNMGVGTSQIENVLEEFRKRGLGLAEVSTGLGPGYAPARQMYLKCGFEPTFRSVTYHVSLN